MNRFYFDNNATTRVHPPLNDLIAFLNSTCYGNPSSVHSLGKQASKWMEDSRKTISKVLGCLSSEEIYFCSSATEGNNTILKGTIIQKRKEKNTIVISDIEHACVRKTCDYLHRFFDTTIKILHVDQKGLINLQELETILKEDKTVALVSIIFGNNEIGTIQPIQEAVQIAHQYEVCFHTDATQMVGKLPLNVKKLDIDLMTASGHKFHGPKGIGLMYIKNTCILNSEKEDCKTMCSLQSQVQGGSQEHNFRSGTENVPGIVAMSIALEFNMGPSYSETHARIEFLRDYVEIGLKELFPDLKVNGDIDHRLPNTSNVTFPESISLGAHKTLSDFFVENQICVSSGSACSRNKTSHVLEAIKLSKEEAKRTIRISLGCYNTMEECNQFLKIVSKLKK